MPAVVVPSSAAEAQSLVAAAGPRVLNFHATWAEPCATLNAVFAELAAEYPQLAFLELDVDQFPEMAEKFSLESVPAFLFLQGGALIDSLMGADAPGLVNKAPVMLFMKGSPDAPRCGFSRKAVALLQEEKVAFGTFDILSDEEVRQGLKTFSNWPTYPQLYSKGKLIGGLDIMNELREDGELLPSLE